MDEISGLPDDVLLKILLLVPTKVAVSTSILSKRWKFLWMWLPKLEYIFNTGSVLRDSGFLLRDFIDKNLPLHRSPVIECLRLRLQFGSFYIEPEYVRLWVEIAVSRHVRELQVDYYSGNQNIFPSSLFTCKSLATLKLSDVTLIEVPSMLCLPSLKTLLLRCVRFIDGKSLQQFLSVCPVLEDLSVQFFPDDNLREFTIIVPSLQSLSLCIPDDWILDGYEIDTPSLKYLKLEDWSQQEHYSLIKNMPKLREAYVEILSSDTNSLIIGSNTSVKRLTICCSEDMYGDGCVFKELEHLNICVCGNDSWKLLDKLLKGSPNLQVLDISPMKDHGDYSGMDYWNQPTSIPECLLSSLHIFNWSGYSGRRQDRDIAVYILKNASHLKKATISIKTRFVPKLEMIKELTLSPPASSTCQFVFAET